MSLRPDAATPLMMSSTLTSVSGRGFGRHAVGLVQQRIDVARERQVRLDFKTGTQLNVFHGKKIARVDHRDK